MTRYSVNAAEMPQLSGWLTQRTEKVSAGAAHKHGPVPRLLLPFCKADERDFFVLYERRVTVE